MRRAVALLVFFCKLSGVEQTMQRRTLRPPGGARLRSHMDRPGRWRPRLHHFPSWRPEGPFGGRTVSESRPRKQRTLCPQFEQAERRHRASTKENSYQSRYLRASRAANLVRDRCLPPALVNHPTLHHKIHFLQNKDVLQRIGRHCHNVGQFTDFNASDLVLHPEQL